MTAGNEKHMTNELRVQGSVQACWLSGNSECGKPNTGPVSNTKFYPGSEYDDYDVNAKTDFKFYSLIGTLSLGGRGDGPEVKKSV